MFSGNNDSKTITVTIKLFSGLNKEIQTEGYDPGKGMSLSIKKGSRLKGVLKGIGLKNLSSNAYFRSGERIGLWTKLRDGDEVSCLRPSGGG